MSLLTFCIKRDSYWFRTSHWKEYRTLLTSCFLLLLAVGNSNCIPIGSECHSRRNTESTDSDISPGFCYAENLVAVPSPQTHLYSATLTPRPNKHPLSTPCTKRLACIRAAWPRRRTMLYIPRSLCLISTSFPHLQQAWSCKGEVYTRGLYGMSLCPPAFHRLHAESHLSALLCMRSSIET
jgi:hypothetical protein